MTLFIFNVPATPTVKKGRTSFNSLMENPIFTAATVCIADLPAMRTSVAASTCQRELLRKESNAGPERPLQ